MNQLVFKFPFKTTYYEKDFFVSSNNFEAYKLIESLPKWPDKKINIYGPSGCGKTHLINILSKKLKLLSVNADKFDEKIYNLVENFDCIVIENYDKNINENLLYSFINQVLQLNKILIINSLKNIKNFKINLIDLKSRLDSFMEIQINLPTDELIRVIISKTFSDRQIDLNNKNLEFIIKNIERSYEKILKFTRDIDNISLSTGKSININLIKKYYQMNKYRTHNCSELTESDNNKIVTLSGWVHRKRDHGNLLFIDLRDHFGLTQCVIEKNNKFFKTLEKIKPESVISITGKVLKREKGTENLELKTGKIEVSIETIKVLSDAKDLPMPIFGEQDYPEDIRLKYRFLDLRRVKMHKNIILRSDVISFIRKEMLKLGFLEFQTPILTSSSPEGARDFLVPSRLNPGKFYALPQAPQQFKQLIMVSGFDKYFQIAPCFRDEDARADRSPGEFYQLDIEMSFVEQEDVFKVVETLMVNLFKKFSKKKKNFKYQIS